MKFTSESGHINNHETGAIEATGHKVIALSGEYGKLTAQQIADYVDWHSNDECKEHFFGQQEKINTLLDNKKIK